MFKFVDTEQVFPGLGKLTAMYRSESDLSTIGQLDGNVSQISDLNNSINPQHPHPTTPTPTPVSQKQDKIYAALCLPTVATYNLRSMIPKIGSLTTDILERRIDCAFLTEIWENEDNQNHQFEIEKLLELHGLQYISSSRKPNSKGVAYGGAAILVNLGKLSRERIPVHTPSELRSSLGTAPLKKWQCEI